MEWYWIYLIVVALLVFLSIFVMSWKDGEFKDFFKNFHIVILLTIAGVIASPFILLSSFAVLFSLLDNDSKRGITRIIKFDIGNVDENLKEVLRHLGFEEGTFQSNNINRTFVGFKKFKYEITYDGKCMFFGSQTEEDNFLIKLLKNLDTTEKEIKRLEKWLDYEKKSAKINKETLKRYEERIATLKGVKPQIKKTTKKVK